MEKKICHVTTVHRATDTRILRHEAKTIAETGCDVTLIAQHDRNETIDGVRILALPRARNRFTRMLGLSWKAFGLALGCKADLYHLHDPELLVVGLALKILTRARLVRDVHENLAEQVLNKEWIAAGLRPVVSALVRIAEKVLTRWYDEVVPATEAIARHINHPRTTVIHNYPDLGMFHGIYVKPEKEGKGSGPLVYIGGISRIRGIYEILAALDRCSQETDPHLELIGPFSSPMLEAEVRAAPGFRRVNYRGILPWESAWMRASEAIGGLVLFHPGPNHNEALPNKLFEYMASGIAVIASNFPLWQEIVEGSECGITVDPMDIDAVARAIEHLVTNPEEAAEMGKRGRLAVEETFNWDAERTKLISAYGRVLA